MMRRHASPTASRWRRSPRCPTAMRIVAALLVLVSTPGLRLAGLAAPATPHNATTVRFDVPGWMSAETASQLDLGFDVLVPPDVPAPFDGEPAIETSDGYYQLYWLIP